MYFSGKRFSIVAKNFYPICKLSLCLIEMANPMMLQPPRTVWSRRNIFQSHWFHYVSDSFHINLLQDERRRVVGIATAAAGNELVEPVSFFFPLTRFTPLVPVCKTEDFFHPKSSCRKSHILGRFVVYTFIFASNAAAVDPLL